MLEDRAGKDVHVPCGQFAEIRGRGFKRPEIAPGLVSTFLPSVPQQFLEVDREKVAEARRCV